VVRATCRAGTVALEGTRLGGGDVTTAWVDALSAAADTPGARVVTLRWPPPARAGRVDAAAVANAVGDVRMPVIVGVAGGLDLGDLAVVLAADLCVAATGAAFDLHGAGTGTVLRGGLVPRLARALGPGRATALALLGGRLGVRDAVRLGLVCEVVPRPQLGGRLRKLAASLATRGPLALALAKEAVLRALDLPLADGIKLEHDLYVLLQTTADRREGVRAFLRHRAPRFRAS